jgi:hypothetical protein
MVRSQVRGAQDDGLLSGQRRSGTLSTVRWEETRNMVHAQVRGARNMVPGQVRGDQ